MRLLFVPVTSPRGSGEYSRCMAIAALVTRQFPGSVCHFVLSEEAPYARDCPYPATWLPSSPTFNSAQVINVIAELQPSIVLFDNAGRTVQLRAARSAGAKVIFVSSRVRQRRRAYRLRWLRLVDEHWIAYPKFMAGPASTLERVKAAVMRRPLARYVDCLLPEESGDPLTPGTLRAADDSILVLTGGVADHRDFASAPRVMAQAAARLALQGISVKLIGSAPEALPSHRPDRLRILPRLPVADLVREIRSARVVVCNGGDTLVQVLALGTPCVAVAMAPDQVRRLSSCRAAGLDLQSGIDVAELASRASSLWSDVAAQRQQLEIVSRLEVTNARESVLAVIARLATMAESGRRAADGYRQGLA